mgnify:CR=1 FL=1
MTQRPETLLPLGLRLADARGVVGGGARSAVALRCAPGAAERPGAGGRQRSSPASVEPGDPGSLLPAATGAPLVIGSTYRASSSVHATSVPSSETITPPTTPASSGSTPAATSGDATARIASG